MWLTREQAACVAETLVRAAGRRGWRIIRAATMSNHTHVVITDCPDDGPAVRRVLKGVTQAALCETFGGSRRWWTEDGSDRYKHDHAAIAAAVNYVANQPGMLAGIEDTRPFVVEPDGTRRFLEVEAKTAGVNPAARPAAAGGERPG